MHNQNIPSQKTQWSVGFKNELQHSSIRSFQFYANSSREYKNRTTSTFFM